MILTRRVLPKQAEEARADLKLLANRAASTNVLDLGDSGKTVLALQRLLKYAGTYPGQLTGQFDAATQTALQAFQAAKKLTASGALDRATMKELTKVYRYVKAGFKESAHVGERGSDVLAAERKLAKLGFLKANEVDGIYDADTKAAVLRYRRADPDLKNKTAGVIGEGMYSELSKASKAYDHDPLRRRDVTDAKGLKRHKDLDALVSDAIKKAGPDGLALHAKGRAVAWLEKHLEAAGYELGKQDTRFGSRTEAALRAFQQHAGLPVTGKLDSKSWASLKNSLFGASSGTSPAQKVGERSGSVLRTEKLLKKLGYKVGKVDGYFTSNTEKAVKAFQKKNKLNVTGAVGTGTANAIDKKVKALWNPGSWKPGPGRLPGGDFSHYQSTSLFNSVIQKSKWGAIKATEGTGYTDPTFKSRWATMGKLVKAGKMKLRVAYHFMRPGNGVAQAKKFLSTLGIKGKLEAGTRLALDWEASALSDPKALRDAANYIHKVTGVWPLVYASASQISRVRAAVPKAPLWMAKWSSDIPKNVPFVQYSDGPGYDHDVFNGNVKALMRFAGYNV